MRAHLHSVDGGGDGGVSRADPIRVVLADDHAALRRSLRSLLEREEDLKLVGEASDFEGALGQSAAHRPAVLVVDLDMADGSVTDRIVRLRENSPRTEILVTTMRGNRAFADAVLNAGAIAVVLSDRADLDLCDGVRSAARGCEYRSPRLHREQSGDRVVGRDG